LRFSRAFALVIPLTFTLGAAACGGEGGSERLAERAANGAQSLHVTNEASAPDPSSATQRAPAAPASWSAGELTSVAQVDRAASDLTSARPDFASKIRALEPGPTRNQAILRFTGDDFRDPDAAVIFAQ